MDNEITTTPAAEEEQPKKEKKPYVSPEIEVIYFEVQDIIANSYIDIPVIEDENENDDF